MVKKKEKKTIGGFLNIHQRYLYQIGFRLFKADIVTAKTISYGKDKGHVQISTVEYGEVWGRVMSSIIPTNSDWSSKNQYS